MRNFFTLAATAALASATLGAQAQFTVDGKLGATELGVGADKYQLLGTYTGTHSEANRGLKALYMGTTATTLNVLVVASPETTGYPALVLYLDAPNKTGVAANVQLPASDASDGPLKYRPTLDMPVDYGFRITVSPLADANGGAMYISKVDYTTPVTAGNTANSQSGLGSGPKNGVIVTDSHNPGAKSAFSSTTTIATNTTTGWEFEIPLSLVGGAASGDIFHVMAAYLTNDTNYSSDVLPQITGQTAGLGANPDFSKIAGNQFFTYQAGAGVLATRGGAAALKASIYPNPVAAGSRLAYTVPASAQVVNVNVYNGLGQKVSTLLSATQQAGAYTLDLAPLHKLAAGSYLVTLRVGTQLSSHRVTVE